MDLLFIFIVMVFVIYYIMKCNYNECEDSSVEKKTELSTQEIVDSKVKAEQKTRETVHNYAPKVSNTCELNQIHLYDYAASENFLEQEEMDFYEEIVKDCEPKVSDSYELQESLKNLSTQQGIYFERTDKGIYYLHHTYYSTKYEESDGVAKHLIALKQGSPTAINRFATEVEIALYAFHGGDLSILHDRCIALVPSHNKGVWSDSMSRMVAKICQDYKMKDYSKAIERVQDHEKMSFGGGRSVESHLQTLRVNANYEILGKEIIVMDDITISANTFLACARVLRAAGAKKVMAIALAKTFVVKEQIMHYNYNYNAIENLPKQKRKEKIITSVYEQMVSNWAPKASDINTMKKLLGNKWDYKKIHFKKDSNSISYIHTYYPVRYDEHKGVSKSLLDLKSGNGLSTYRFTIEVECALYNFNNGDLSVYKDKCIVLVPSHNIGAWSPSMLKMVERICKDFNMKNYSKAIERVQEHEKLALGGNRSVKSHLRTLAVNDNYEILGKEIIVMDDITTSGNSIEACYQVLLAAGAKKVTAITLAKTYDAQ